MTSRGLPMIGFRAEFELAERVRAAATRNDFPNASAFLRAIVEAAVVADENATAAPAPQIVRGAAVERPSARKTPEAATALPAPPRARQPMPRIPARPGLIGQR